MSNIKIPERIEEKSFEIIEKEMGDWRDKFSILERPIIKRVIHTTADFEYMKLIKFSDGALLKGLELLKKGEKIYCDTSMIVSGINKRKTAKLGIELINLVHDEEVRKNSFKNGTTRSMEAVEKALKVENIKIFVIGNAPTALFKLKELIDKGYEKPELIIGVPVGFVGAEESKKMLEDINVPYITVEGRKGGSTVAVAIINGLLKMI
ncbi:MAG: precorrin-8X methylmutase [Bacillota bacterium]|nr:precorrin-8X methylmutase [Bacillota bacterium]